MSKKPSLRARESRIIAASPHGPDNILLMQRVPFSGFKFLVYPTMS